MSGPITASTGHTASVARGSGVELSGWVEASAAPSDAVAQMYAGTLDGVVLRSLMDAPARDAAIQAVRRRDDWQVLYEDPAAPKSLGIMLAPTMVQQAGPPLEDYFREAETDARWFDEHCPGVFEQLEARVSALASGRPCRVLQQPRAHRPATIRRMPEGYGAMPHRDAYPRIPSFENLFLYTDRTVQLSWYILLRAPSGGGALEVSVGGDEGTLEPVPLSAGDGVLFAGSRILHTVTNVVGEPARLSLGGFAGWSTDRDALLYWS